VPPRPRNLRVLALVASLCAAVAALGIVLLGVSSRATPDDRFNATAISPSRPAPLTRGAGVDGRAVRVSVEGGSAVVTFLFANCPDVCPAVAAVLARALDDLGDDAGELDVVAVSVDPAGDTREDVADFLERFRLRGRMDYITGTRAELAPIWRDWFVLAQDAGADASVHSARVVLIDRDGRQVAAWSAGIPVPVDELSEDLRTLLDS
jgi:protein SCO1